MLRSRSASASSPATTRVGPASRSMAASSRGSCRAYSGTTMAPSARAARSKATQSAQFGAARATRSPGATPAPRRDARAAATLRPSSRPVVGRSDPVDLDDERRVRMGDEVVEQDLDEALVRHAALRWRRTSSVSAGERGGRCSHGARRSPSPLRKGNSGWRSRTMPHEPRPSPPSSRGKNDRSSIPSRARARSASARAMASTSRSARSTWSTVRRRGRDLRDRPSGSRCARPW